MKLPGELFGAPTQLIMDPVHGGIPFFKHEKRVINHPLFQRLRHIKQNDMLFLVFPGATHSRFQHSIGTMHVAGKLMKNMIRVYLIESYHVRKKIVSKFQSEAISYIYFCLRLAALLHDTGHAPFSHAFESSPEIKKILNGKETFEKLWKGENWQKYYKKIPDIICHEHYSVRCAHKI